MTQIHSMLEFINGTYFYQLSWLSATPSVCLCVRDIYADCQIYMLEIPEVNTPFMLIVAGRYGSVSREKALDWAAIIL